MAAPRDEILAAVDLLAPTLEEAGLDELELQVGELRVRLARPRPVIAAQLAPSEATPPAASPPPPDPGTFPEATSGMHQVTAPLTGVWYPAPSPGARPYVNEGDEVNVGQVIGLIEAMKLFNEIKSNASGRISRVLVENGTLVKRKQPLLEIDPR